MKVKYIGPSDEVYIVVGESEISAKRNHTIDVPNDVAGTPPDPRLHPAMVELGEAVTAGDHEAMDALSKEIDGLDRGSGLLAQDIWSAVEAKKKEDDK